MDAVDDREPVSIVFDAPYMSNPIVTGLLSLAVLLPVTADGQSSDPPSPAPRNANFDPATSSAWTSGASRTCRVSSWWMKRGWSFPAPR